MQGTQALRRTSHLWCCDGDMWLPDSLVLRMVFTILARLGPVSFPAQRRHTMHDPGLKAFITGPGAALNVPHSTGCGALPPLHVVKLEFLCHSVHTPPEAMQQRTLEYGYAFKRLSSEIMGHEGRTVVAAAC